MNSVSIEIPVHGMDCANCARGIERHFDGLGLHEFHVDYSNSRAFAQTSPEFPRKRIEDEIRKLGYVVPKEGEDRKLFWTLERKFLVSAVCTLPLALHVVVTWHPLHNPLVQLLLTLPVFILGSFHFGRSAYFALRSGTTNMDVLIFLGSQAAFWYSLYGFAIGEAERFLFFETAATIITTVFLGNLLEARALKRTSSAIESLAAIQPQQARRITSQLGKEQLTEVPSSEIGVGERLLVNTGERIPTDGIVYWGEALVDESMITGESIPQEKREGSSVIGGTILVQGSIKIRTTAVGANTTLANIIRLVREAQSQRPQIQRLADKISQYFVPAVVFIAALTLLLSWQIGGVGFAEALIRAVAVLVIACPCAMGLATPTAVMVGLGKAARAGILVRGGTTLEKLASTKTAVFDKTGTLTTGSFQISEFRVLGSDEQEVKAAFKALEQHSNHPLAKAIVQLWPEVPELKLSSVQEERGIGVQGSSAQGVHYQVCSTRAFAERTGTAIDAPPSGVLLLRNNIPVAILTLTDAPRPDAEATIRALRDLSIESILVSGDSKEKCTALAEAVGIRNVHAEKLPDQKLSIIQNLEQSAPTMFVGDGINDAPALSRATVGVSMSEASQAAVQASQVILLSGSLSQLPSAVRIARGTVSTIKQNLFWAFLYNTLAIPVAALGYLSPMIGAFAMAFSDLIVIGNSIRFRYRRI